MIGALAAAAGPAWRIAKRYAGPIWKASKNLISRGASKGKSILKNLWNKNKGAIKEKLHDEARKQVDAAGEKVREIISPHRKKFEEGVQRVQQKINF